jgi:16S rRNA G966 N2-methylase RsmD
MKAFVAEWALPVTVVQQDVIKFLREATRQWDYIFADPPYDMKGIEAFPDQLLSSAILKEGGFFVLEHFSGISFKGVAGFTEARHYGQSVFSFFSRGS